ncbi:MAG: hypothetical protein JXM73_22800, partial [Anaerolineae bacterium]|nr:hypothetical protein [Anaerolineae bacterium]
MKMRVTAASLVALVALAAVGIASAQTSPNYDLGWHVLSPGGSEWSSSGTHMVNGTLSQFAIGPAAAAGGHSIGSGYWYGVRQATLIN